MRAVLVRMVLMVWLAGVAGYGLLILLRGTDPLFSALGLVLAGLGPLSYLARSFRDRGSPAPGRHPVGYSIVAGLGLAMTLAMSWRYGPAAGQHHVWAGITLLIWWAYLRLLRS